MRAQTPLDFAIGVSVFLVVVTFVLAFVPGMLQPFEGSTQQETAASDRIAGQLVENSLVADQREPYVLDRECTIAFFDDDGDSTNGDGDYGGLYDTGTYAGSCNFPDLPLRERMALDQLGLQFRIRLVRDLESTDPAVDPGVNLDPDPGPIDTLCLDADDRRIVESADPFDDDDDGDGSSESWEVQCDLTGGDDDVLFSIGDTPPENVGSVVVARRVVSLEGGLGDGTHDASLIVEVW